MVLQLPGFSVETLMKTAIQFLRGRMSTESLDSRIGQLTCYFAGLAIVPISVVALARHPSSRPDFIQGIGLAVLNGILCLMLGTLCRNSLASRGKLRPRVRSVEFISYFACAAILIGGVRWLPSLALTPTGITLGLLLIGSLSLAVLVLGMMSSAFPRRSASEKLLE